MKKEIEYNNIKFDSYEELYMYYFLEELFEHNFIKNFDYHPESLILSNHVKYNWKNKNKYNESILLREHIYTYDYKISWNTKSKNIFYNNIDDNIKIDKIPFIAQNDVSMVEIKPEWDMNNMTRLFNINNKWVYEKYKLFIQKIVPISHNNNCLFAKTFTPIKATVTNKTKKPKKYKFEIKTLQDFLNNAGK